MVYFVQEKKILFIRGNMFLRLKADFSMSLKAVFD